MNPVRSESAAAGTAEITIDESAVSHSHHYDAALHRAITETGTVDGRRTLERAAASAAFRALAGSAGADPDREIRALFASTGLGSVLKCEIGAAGGSVSVAPSDFVKARVDMFGRTATPSCDIARGVLAGAVGALHDAAFEVTEVECVTMGARICRFAVHPDAAAATPATPLPFEWPGRGMPPAPDSSRPSQELLAEVSGSAGVSSAVTRGRLWAEMYARATYDFEEQVPEEMGAKFSNLASIVLTEAAHLGTFYSVGGLVRSGEWRQRVVPVLPAREDWVHAIIALVDSYGWGSWRIRLLAPEQRFTVQVHDGYEALSYLAIAGKPATSPRCYFSRGFVGGLMNTLFGGDALSPASLDQKVYSSLFRSPSSFRAIETRCQAMGDPCCEFVANPLSPGLRRS